MWSLLFPVSDPQTEVVVGKCLCFFWKKCLKNVNFVLMYRLHYSRGKNLHSILRWRKNRKISLEFIHLLLCLLSSSSYFLSLGTFEKIRKKWQLFQTSISITSSKSDKFRAIRDSVLAKLYINLLLNLNVDTFDPCNLKLALVITVFTCV
jgi:hypothetical protein